MDCPTGKRVYRSERAAAHALAVCQGERPDGDRRTEVAWYPCPHCYGYHLTSRPR